MRALGLLMAILWCMLFAVATLASITLLVVPLNDPQWYLHCAPAKYQLIDFSQFYQAGQLAVSPDAHRVYDATVQNAWAAHLISPNLPDKIFYNQSVPFLYVLLIPFGALPYNLAYVAWCLTTMGLAAAALFLLVSKAGYLRGRARFMFLAGVLVSIPSYLTIWHGQTAYLLTAALALFALGLMRKNDPLAAVALALSTFKPQYMLPLVALTGGLGRYKVLIGLCLAEACLMGLAALFIGVENILAYPAVLTHAEASTHFIGVNPHYMVSIRGILSALAPHKTAMLITIAALLTALGPIFIIARRSSEDKLRWSLCLTFLAALVFSPHSHFFDCLLLAIPAALTLDSLDLVGIWSPDNASSTTIVHRWWCSILLLYPLISWPINFLPGGDRVLEGALFLAINSVLLVLAGLRLRQEYEVKDRSILE